VFAEFAYEADLKKFIELAEIPKFREGEDMIYMTKDAYVKMKAKEKGIAESEIFKGNQTRKGAAGGKFNAFREMDKMKKGQAPALAKIPAEVEVVGKAVAVEGRGQKRDREDGDNKPSKKQREEEPLTIEYKGVQLDVDPVTGKVVDPSKVPVSEKTAIKFSAPGDGTNWKDLKADIVKAGFASPFMVFPPGSKGGNISNSEGVAISDEDLTSLNAAGITYGSEGVTFERMSGELKRYGSLRTGS
jgi:lupus La protein